MKIKTKLLLMSVIAGVLVLTVSAVLITVSERLSTAFNNEAKATKLVDTISQIRFVSFEYLLHHDQRSYEQWQIKHAQLAEQLQSTSNISPEVKVSLTTISNLSQDVEAIFTQLTKNNQATPNSQMDSEKNLLEERLGSQLLIKQQEQIQQALQISNQAQQQVTDLGYLSNIVIVFVIGFMLLITIANYLFTTKTITQSLQELQIGAEAIAAGMFDYRIHARNKHDEFATVAEAFNTMAESTGALDKEKTEFILLASHQLRTPLTAVKWYTEALAKHADTLGAGKLKLYATQVYDSNERMIELVNKLLDAARVEANNLQSQPQLIQLENALQEALDDLSPQIRENKISIEKTVDSKLPTVFADPSWVRVILENLLSNAVRYSHKGEKVHVNLNREKNHAVISIADNGFGIPAKQRDKIFTKLFRADNAKQVIGEGSGLDLYITKAMVERTGGTISFKSTENKGTTFYVTFPVYDHRATTHPETTTELAPPQKERTS